MHENCNIMRDLMPLCIDGAASDDSHRAVSRHIADCDECLKYFREMQTDMTRALAARPTEDEVTANILVYENKIIGGDICSVNLDGFMHGFTPPDGVVLPSSEQLYD